MTNEEAIKELKEWKLYSNHNYPVGALDMAIEALEANVVREKMTNREWLNSLSNTEFVNIVLFELPQIGKSYSDSVSGLSKWMDEEHYYEANTNWNNMILEKQNENKETNNNH